MPKKSGKTEPWYGWAELVDPAAEQQLSPKEINTLEWARHLAASKREWAALPPHEREQRWPSVTVEDIAHMPGQWSRIDGEVGWDDSRPVSRRITVLRRKLFGDIGRRAIYARAARRAEVRQRSWRQCSAPRCSNLIPPDARADKDTCSDRCRRAKQRHK